MADIQTELLTTMQQLIQQLRNGSLSGGGSKKKTNQERFADQNKDPIKAAADRQRMEKAIKEGTKALKDAFKSQENYGKDFKVAGAAFQNAVSKLSLKTFDELPKRINELTKQYQFNFQAKEDIDKAIIKYSEQNIDAAKKLHEQIINLNHELPDYAKQYDMLIAKLSKTGITLDELNGNIHEKQKALGQALNEISVATEKNIKSQERMAEVSALVTAALLGLANKGVEATKAAARLGVDIVPLGAGMVALGMSAEELGKLQNENIQGLHAAGESFWQFDGTLIKGAYDLAAFTGSMTEGAKLAANLFHNFRQLSADTSQQDKFMKSSSDIFKQMHDTVGETSDQFAALTQSIMSNQDVQVNMYRLGEKQRTQALLDLEAQTAELRNLGLMDDEAKAVIATFAQLGAQGPKERRKQAAQLMAVGGALGMGDQARTMAMMLQRGETNTPEFAKLAAMMQKQAQQQYSNVKGSAGEFAQFALTNMPGVQQILGQAGPIAAMATRGGMATPNEVKRQAALHAGVAQPATQAEKDMVWSMKERDTLITAVTSIDDQVKGLFGKGLVGVITAVWAFFKGKNLIKGLLGVGETATATLGAEAGGAGVAATAGAGVAATAGAAVAAIIASGTAIHSLYKAVKGEDASNWISNLDQKYGGLGEMITDGLTSAFGPKAAAKTPDMVKREEIIHEMIKDRAAIQGGKLDDPQQQMMMTALDNLTGELAKMNGKDPAKAIEDMHKTLKMQHQENKDMTQEQTDAIKSNKQVKSVKTSDRLGTNS